MGERRFRKVEKGYKRAQEKAQMLTAVDDALVDDLDVDYYDPLIASTSVGGGDPGLAILMEQAAREMMGETIETHQEQHSHQPVSS